MALILLSCVQVYSADESREEIKDIKPFDVEAESAVLMEAKTGRVLYAKSADKALPPASVTKVMTLLLVMEEIDSGNMKLSDMISVSEYAASMGGSQVFLEAGEEMSLEDMLKSVVISSANDAAVALAEAVAGSEEAFVAKMNEKAAELSMKSTHFENVTGLDDDTKDHKMSAYDIAVASRELICSHPSVLKYSSIWMDTIRGGEFGLSNTNRLIRFYKGATGLKTGSTSKAGFCISATAERDGMHLIAVIMGSETRDTRNEAAKKLLDHGFANYCIYEKAE
ncbi:MAG: D-alanyl-D-alanine carboxypeptidase, partial [Clostridia bacterium]|nr:D-alanyl-D-alanine carboxypeptidase [Clostridia bacterium]